MRGRLRAGVLAGVILGSLLVGTVEAQGPFSAQIQRALNAFVSSAHTWTGTQTLAGPLLFSPDSTFDIGASNVTRPANIWASGQVSGKTFAPIAVSGSGYTWSNGNRFASNDTPTISSGFGTSPAITGTASVFRITLGNPVAQAGVVNFNLGVAFGSAPLVNCRDETTPAANPPAYVVSTTQLTLTFSTAVAADKIGCIVFGLP